MNLEIIKINIEEARQELERIEEALSCKTFDEVEYALMLEHAYHHLNVAWNAREASTERYGSMTDEEFEAWRRVPRGLDDCVGLLSDCGATSCKRSQE